MNKLRLKREEEKEDAARRFRGWENFLDNVQDRDGDARSGMAVRHVVDISLSACVKDGRANAVADAISLSTLLDSMQDTTASSSTSHALFTSAVDGKSLSPHSLVPHSRVSTKESGGVGMTLVHRKKDSGNAEQLMNGAVGRASAEGEQEGEHRGGRLRLRKSLTDVMNRGRPNKARREVRQASGDELR
jgi:hypothetical protein